MSVATPYPTQGGLSAYVDAVGEATIRRSQWLVCLNLKNAIDGATEPDAVQRLLNLGAEVRTHSRLHAKLYLFQTDGSLTFGAANPTQAGPQLTQRCCWRVPRTRRGLLHDHLHHLQDDHRCEPDTERSNRDAGLTLQLLRAHVHRFYLLLCGGVAFLISFRAA